MRARRRMFVIVTSALTGALVIAAPAIGAAAAEPNKATGPLKKQISTQDVPTTAAAALEETSDLFGNLGRDLEEALNDQRSTSTDAGKTAEDQAAPKRMDADKPVTDRPVADKPLVDKPLGDKPLGDKDLDKDLDKSLDVTEASKLSRLVSKATQSLVNGVDNVIGSMD